MQSVSSRSVPLAGGTAFWLILRGIRPDRSVRDFDLGVGALVRRPVTPSGALTVAVRMVERERLGASKPQMLSATAYEQLVAVAAAAAVSLGAFAAAGRRPPVVAVVVLVGVFVLTVSAQPVVRRWGRRRQAAGRLPESVLLRTGVLVSATLLCVSSWLVAGVAAWTFVASVTGGPTPSLSYLLGAYTFAWLVGFVVPFAPSGLGVREATLIALLAPVLGAAPATALSVGLRLANVAGNFSPSEPSRLYACSAGDAEAPATRTTSQRRRRDARLRHCPLHGPLCGGGGGSRLVHLSPELVRKLAHMSSAVFAALLPLVLSFSEIAILGVGFAGLMAVSLRVGIFNAIHGVSRATYGEVFFPLGIAALAVACPSKLPFAFGVLVLGVCDGLAALVGERFGRRVVPLVQTRKTLWGTSTFLVACFALGVLLLLPPYGRCFRLVCPRRRSRDGARAYPGRALPYLRPRQPRAPDRGRFAPQRAMSILEVVYLISPLLAAGAVHAPHHRTEPPPLARPSARLRPHPARQADPRL